MTTASSSSRAATAALLCAALCLGCGDGSLNLGADSSVAPQWDAGDAYVPPPRPDSRIFTTDSRLGRPCIDGAICDDAGTIIADPGCGDGLINREGEECDDRNTLPGDGCSGVCQVEPNYACPIPGSPCQSTVKCGDGEVMGAEICDDGNEADDDGCSADCSAIEIDYACPPAGGECTPLVLCGDGRVNGAERCDDRNVVSDDGCSSDCLTIESGYACPSAGQPCVRVATCGDGIRSPGEACDDKNAQAGDGCSADCHAIEANYVCPAPGQPCVSTVVCGDRRVGGGETCDDGNTDSDDGCSSACALEPGWRCAVVGAACTAAACGDGILVDTEECEDGDAPPADGDGCSARCRLEPGFVCETIGAACRATVCGDGVAEGSEACDDGGLCDGPNRSVCTSDGDCTAASDGARCEQQPFDGCSLTCTREASCAAGTCTPICGDGVILPVAGQEQCDDGNTRGGDGCSATCTLEPGFSCVTEPEALPGTLRLPVVIRDFKGIQWYTQAQGGHRDFNDPNDGNDVIAFGLVDPQLDAEGRPALSYASAPSGDGTGRPKTRAEFAQWYRTDATVNRTGVREIALVLAGGAYGFDSGELGFYPLDDGGWVAEGSEALRNSANDNEDHNFNFTTETHFLFQYDGSEVLTFSGDDDLWVFIDGQLCLDVGGLHPARSAVMNLANPSEETDATQRAVVTSCAAHLDALRASLGFDPLVEATIFHAERHTGASNFRLTLRGFVKSRSTCDPNCGDGVVTRLEVCDDGVNDGSYGGCMPGCQALGAFCGDGLTQTDSGEQCDDGVNTGVYDACAPGCRLAARCGDGQVDAAYGEQCDDVANDGGYDQCAPGCLAGDRCGDGFLQTAEGEQCDDGLNDGGYGECAPSCLLGERCGDGVTQLDEGERCDDGDNDGGYGECAAGCRLGPRCGDGARQASEGEQCDDGVNDGGYGECGANCRLGPHCGDGVVQSDSGEQCDDQLNDGGYGECAPGCQLGLRCGDGVLQSAQGEECDDGNDQNDDGCSATCQEEDTLH